MDAPAHSINGEIVLSNLITPIEIKKEDMKMFSVGPDTLISTDFKTFEYQHSNKTREFFITLVYLIKEYKLYENSEVMAFLYGQVNHFVADSVTHPMIYYMTEDIKSIHRIKPHGLVEFWMDEYYMSKYNKIDFNYEKTSISDPELIKLINEVYKRVYNVKNEGVKYSRGILLTNLFHTCFRKNKFNIPKKIQKICNMGDVIYHGNYKRVLPFMNLNHEKWTDPITGEEYYSSFDDLFSKATWDSLDTIDDINKYIYQDKELKNPYILNNISYNTGFPCEKGKKFIFVKHYNKRVTKKTK